MTNVLYRNLVQLSERVLPADIREPLRRYIHDRRSARNAAELQRRIEWWEAHLGKQESVVTKIEAGMRMRLFLGGELSRLIFLDQFEMEERTFLRWYLRPGDTFVDVGANLGLFSLVAGALVGESGSVHSFEPCSETFQRLRGNVEMNHLTNVHLHQLALSDTSGTRELITATDGMDAWNSLAQPHTGQGGARETITTRTWDEFAQEHSLAGRVAFMKIDVEGWEAPVLTGGRETLSRPDAPVLQVEFTEEAAAAAGYSCPDVYRQLESYGYRIYRFEPAERALVHDPIRETYPYMNLFAAKDLAGVQARLAEGSARSK